MTTAAQTRIIAQLKDGHADMCKAGLGSPALDAFHETVIEIVSESPDPQATIRALADLMAEERARTACMARP
ncbi:hypothetical protein ABZU94_29890 [Streptomyces mirabilis]|uniref:hypothetical protein n=1 Tax=Streptomyces sp. NPDC005388 TaxID=3156717 RepID=UPI0033A72D7D